MKVFIKRINRKAATEGLKLNSGLKKGVGDNKGANWLDQQGIRRIKA